MYEYYECETFWLLLVFAIFFLYAKMQENTNFETIITTWRRLSGELQSEPVLESMSGDSDNNRKKKEEEATLLVPDKLKSPLPSVTTSAIVATEAVAEASTSPEEKHEFIQRDKGDTNEPTSDSNDKDYLENKENDDIPELKTADKSTEWERGKIGDKVDSVYLRSPPPHKARSTASTAAEDDDCGIKCLYFTLQCCDCVLM